MTTAAIKKESHIVEYVLYVWQMEDVARAAKFDVGALRSMFAGQEDEDLEWVLELSRTMQREHLEESGHVAHIQETLTEMALLHDLLVGPMDDATYVTSFQSAEPMRVAVISPACYCRAVTTARGSQGVYICRSNTLIVFGCDRYYSRVNDDR